MALVLILDGGLGWIVHRAKVQREAVAAIMHGQNQIIYDWDYDKFYRSGKGLNAPRWLVNWLGPDYFGNIAHVRLDGPDRGAEMAQVGRLSHLVSFDALGTDMTDGHAVQLGDLPDLESVSFWNTRGITGETLAGMSELRKLTNLRLIGSSLTDGDLAFIAGHVRLVGLIVESDAITDAGLFHLKGMTKLKNLDLKSRAITGAGLVNLQEMTNLIDLNLEKTQVDDLKSLAGLVNLRSLSLMDTAITDADLAHLRGLTKLTRLFLSRTRVTDAGLEVLASLPSLELLFLDGTAITDAGLMRLSGSRRLGWVAVGQTKISAEQSSAFEKAHPKISVTQ